MYKISVDNYQNLFKKKRNLFSSLIEVDSLTDFFQSPHKKFRNRAEFVALHNKEEVQYGMSINSKKEVITEFPIAAESFQSVMKPLLVEINSSKELSDKLFQIEFQASRSNEIMVTLIYHKKLDIKWSEEAKKTSKELNVSIIGRSKKQIEIVGKNYVTENYKFLEKKFPLRLYEQCFSQTNPAICDDMINWVLTNAPSKEADIMELHCGLGTFTIPLSLLYKKVLATENSRPSIQALKENINLNKRSNIYFGRLSGEETLEAFKKERDFRRLNSINLDDFYFETIFLDPPREGLDDGTLQNVSEFKNIIYLSCGFGSFARDLSQLRKTHRVIKTAMFDQFPYTDHVESGAILERITPD